MSRLTPREREVLDLLATGATNKTIATTLFVTEKTASVHVSNILAKLGRRQPRRGRRPRPTPGRLTLTHSTVMAGFDLPSWSSRVASRA